MRCVEQRSEQHVLGKGTLVPPFRFGYVEQTLFRSGYPKPRGFPFLCKLSLRCVVSLIPDAPTPALQQFCLENDIKLVHIRVDKPKENIPLTYAKTCSILHLLIDQRNQPLLFHCVDGQQICGLVNLCLRRLQGWAITSSISEFLRYVSEENISSEESDFVEKFGGEIEIPMLANVVFQESSIYQPSIPTWLWGGQINFKRHIYPALKIKLPPELERERDILEKDKGEEKDERKGLRNKLLHEMLAPLTSMSQSTTTDTYSAGRASSGTEGDQVSTLVQALALEGLKLG